MGMFRTERGLAVPGVGSAGLSAMRESLFRDYAVVPAQICEAVSYSHAMVVRFALGLSASGGNVCAIVRDSLCGWCALAVCRHLVNSGASATVIKVPEGGKPSDEMSRQLAALSRMKVPLDEWRNEDDSDRLASTLLEHHNVICGLFALGEREPSIFEAICEVLNDIKTPVHTLEAPLGVDPDTGRHASYALYASSTLSLGAPLGGLDAGRDFVGRHYLCDTSFTSEIYGAQGLDYSSVFSEQPVIRIFPQSTPAPEPLSGDSNDAGK